MKTLIIYAHPNTGGHCEYILKKVTSGLKEREENYEVIDLYKIDYDPVLAEKEHYTSFGNRDVSKQNQDFQRKIKDSNHLVFIFPIWWASPPAMLKGFMDRVFVGKFAFKYKGFFPVPLLKGKTASVFMTGGAPTVFFRTLLGSRAQKVFCNDTLGFCGIKSKTYYVGGARKFTKESEKKIDKKVKTFLRKNY
jgi:NAD(P)H dehydrogenase (quinone)